MKRILKLLARLYPSSWRTRYGAEFEALLEEKSPSARDAFDVLSGALKMQMTTWSFTRITFASCVAGTLIAVAISFAIPPRFIAQTVILVAENHMTGHLDRTGRDEITDEIVSMKDSVLSSESLAPIIQEQNLYPRDRDNMPLNAVLDEMRRNITVTPVQKGDLTGFTLNFVYSDPQIAQRVDKELVTHLMGGQLDAGINAASAGQPQSHLVFIVNHEPSVPQKPTFPKRCLFGIFGLLTGLTGGLVLATAVRLHHNKTATNN